TSKFARQREGGAHQCLPRRGPWQLHPSGTRTCGNGGGDLHALPWWSLPPARLVRNAQSCACALSTGESLEHEQDRSLVEVLHGAADKCVCEGEWVARWTIGRAYCHAGA